LHLARHRAIRPVIRHLALPLACHRR
jgi:hypothetical protein